MLKSKLLTVFIAFALLITVGGVYATWSYAGSNLSDIVAPQSFTVTATINDATVKGAPGTLNIDNQDLTYHIKNDNNTYNTALETSGDITISYTPNEGSEYQTVDLVCTITLTNTQYDSKNIFKFDSTAETVLTLTKSAVGNSGAEWVITDADIGLALTEAFNLNTVTKYNAFMQALKGCHLEVDISVDPNTAVTAADN